MGIFDILVLIVALVALVNGWRKGLIIQVCSIAAIVGGVWIASAFGAEVGALLGIEPRYAKAAGFLIIFFVALVFLALVSRLVKKLFSFAGLGVVDSILGALLSVAKVALIVGLLCSAFDSLNKGLKIVEVGTLDKTIFFRPLCRATEVLELFDVDEAGKALEKTVKQVVDDANV
ncbi:MAG: CvpA family protein [Rikenellaceae bacterium]|nr:CvpA family protein [Rikenellaceae bacterium]